MPDTGLPGSLDLAGLQALADLPDTPGYTARSLLGRGGAGEVAVKTLSRCMSARNPALRCIGREQQGGRGEGLTGPESGEGGRTNCMLS